MKKIYSFVLMAAMLLVGTNVKATDVCSLKIGDAEAINYESLEEAFVAMDGTQNKTVVLTMLADATFDGTGLAKAPADGIQELQTENGYVFSGNDFTWDLKSFTVTNANWGRFRLHANNYTIKGDLDAQNHPLGAINFTDLKSNSQCGIYLYGETNEYSLVHTNLTIEKGVTISSMGYAIAVMANGTYAYNVKVDIYGTITSTGESAISILGTVQGIPSQGNEAAAPTINIHDGASVTVPNDKAALYVAGYGNWVIEGTVEGGTGIYAKAGNITIQGNGTVTATAPEHTDAEPNGNGYTGGMGCAIIQDSKNGYAGGMTLVVTGNATLESQASDGYAIEEIKTDASQSKTENITIVSGTLTGDIEMTGELQEQVVLNGTITGGTFSTDISEFLNPTAGALELTASGYEVVEGCVSILNDYGLATFSSPNYNVVLPEDLNVWIVTGGLDGEGKLTLEKVVLSAGAILPEKTGFILEGTANKAFSFIKSTAAATTGDLTANALLSSDKFAAAAKPVYILHDTELWLYEGIEFKEGKAFLPATLFGAGAPKRIQMVFAETQAVENVEVEAVKAEKFIENGQIFIIRGEKVYNVQGQIVK